MSDLTFNNARNVKWAFTTRRVRRDDAQKLLPIDTDGVRAMRPGDVVKARVIEIGQHSGIQLKTGRRAALYSGDEIALCLGARYAPDQFECVAELDGDFAHLVAAGGICGVVTRQHGRMKTPTLLQVQGRLALATGAPINVADYALPPVETVSPRPPVIAVFGASMNAGKTTSAASLIHGLAKADHSVGACKATGTGACGDINAYRDAGAAEILDFTDLGYSSTFGVSLNELREISRGLVNHLALRGADIIVMEIADGVLQTETAALMRDPEFTVLTDGVIFAASDALSAINGVHALERSGHSVMGVSGVLTRSPMACEEAKAALDTRFFSRNALTSAKGATELLTQISGSVAAQAPAIVAA
ncbi:MAG: hypothetical protein AAGA09_00960 [Pseudomonadota bacterium]